MTNVFFKGDIAHSYWSQYKACRIYTTPDLLFIWRGSPDRLIGAICEHGNLRCAEIIVRQGAIAINFGLYSACLGGHSDVVDLMIRSGASEINWGLSGASERGHNHIIDQLARHGATEWNYALFWACRRKQPGAITQIIQHGADYCPNCGNTLHKEASLGEVS